MERFECMADVDKLRLESGICGAVIRALRGKEQIAAPEPYDPEKQGSIWLLRPGDTAESVAAVFGKPMLELTFDGVLYDEEGEQSGHTFLLLLDPPLTKVLPRKPR